jgi:ABC-type maltose transport system permease subunit
MIRKSKPLTKILQVIVAILATIFAVYPIWFTILASGRSGDRLFTLNLAGMFLPTEWTWENYQTMIFTDPLLTWMKNSLMVAGLTTIACLFIATSAAFAFSRMGFGFISCNTIVSRSSLANTNCSITHCCRWLCQVVGAYPSVYNWHAHLHYYEP